MEIIMIDDLRLSVRLIRKSYQFKISVAAMVLFILAGAVEMAIGAVVGGVFIFMGFVLFPIQLLLTLGFSGLVAASPFRRRIQVGFQAKVYLAGCAAGLLFASIYIAVLLSFADAQRKAELWNLFLFYGGSCAVFGIYMTLAFKMFVASTVVMVSCVYLPLIIRPEVLVYGIGDVQFFSTPVTVMLTVGLILLSALIQYVLSSLLYRWPLSKFAVNRNLRKSI
ncbi:MAG: hypothetical protein LUC90_09020 [Lachnospiraceae bacterium]|nr:hypothetical protein [Lachnospiraceae bacterium]